MAFNKIEGTIPNIFGQLKKLSVIILDHNHLNGTLPESFGDAISLRQISFTHNRLTGNIPSTLKSLPLLTQLQLSKNHLDGAVPQLPLKLEWCDLTKNPGLCWKEGNSEPKQCRSYSYLWFFSSTPIPRCD